MQQLQLSGSETISKNYLKEIEICSQFEGVENFFELESKLLYEIHHLKRKKQRRLCIPWSTWSR